MDDQIRKLLKRFEKVEELLGHADVLSDQKQYRELAQEHAYLTDVRDHWQLCQRLQNQIAENEQLLRTEKDPEFLEIVRQEIPVLQNDLLSAQKRLETLLIPPDPRDSRTIIMEIRAGTGGDEAAIFVGDCVRMYKQYADKKGWKYDLLSCTESEMGGFKEYVMVLSGPNVNRFMQYEAGTHRVQRVPKTEAQGRVHTSAVTTAVLLEPDEQEKVVLDERELKIDTYRASGAGGQHVNTTDSAVRITHLPTGTVVYCQEERSQIKNRERAMKMLRAKLYQIAQENQAKQIASARKKQVGTGDRSEKIRTYHFPQNRVTDHRVNLTLHSMPRILDGEIDGLIDAVALAEQAEALAAVG